MIDAQGVVIVGNDTEIGKTTIACQTIEMLRERGIRVGAFKPVASGYTDEDASSDIRQLINATGRALSLDDVCPYRFVEAIAPVMAARKLGVSIDNDVIQSRLEAMFAESEFVVIETAGGLLSPLSDDATNLDFCKMTGLATVVVIENRLGAINQANLVCHALIQADLKIAAVVFNQTKAHDCDSDLLNSNVRMFADMYTGQFSSEPPKLFSVGYQGRLPHHLLELLSHSRRLGL